jgi:phosphocarrier protein
VTEQTVTLVNQLGLHARAAAKFVDAASQFRSAIEIVRGDETVDGKSILGLLTLAAPRGTTLRLVVQGPDEDQALNALVRLIVTKFGEDGYCRR